MSIGYIVLTILLFNDNIAKTIILLKQNKDNIIYTL